MSELHLCKRPRRWLGGLASALLLCCLNASLLAQGYPGHWVGQWIWTGTELRPYHFFLMARRPVDLDSVPGAAATLKITAADRYMLYVNGQYVGRGPARSDAGWTSYDTYDVSSRLKPGKNTLAVLAYHYGTPNGYSRGVRAGLFAQLELKGAGGAPPMIIGTDKSWRVRPAQAWNRNAHLINQGLGVTEIYDAQRDPPDWMMPGFDDSSWALADAIPSERARRAIRQLPTSADAQETLIS